MSAEQVTERSVPVDGQVGRQLKALYCASPQGPFLDQEKQPQQSGDLRGNQAAIDSYCVYL